jgi:DNA (cytosine-5)-methyltransferase 1
MSSPVAGSLFTGIGGLDLGLERAGWRIAWQSEIEPYCCRVLNARWPTVPNLGDVATVNFEEVEPVELIAGGYPCQPFSVAGKQAGTDDPRYLWPHFARALRLLRPRFALLENVPGHLANGFGDVLADLAALGYDAEWESVPAEAFGAPHLRWRVFVVAYTDGRRRQGRRVAQPARVEGPPWDLADRRRPVRVFDDAPAGADASAARRPGPLGPEPGRGGDALRPAPGNARGLREPGGRTWWDVEPDVGRVAHGVPARVDRLRALGNAVVPQVAEWVGSRILLAR